MKLFGQDTAIDAFRDAMDSGKLHHAWLLAGPRGVGKALFADMAARRMLAQAARPEGLGEGLSVPDIHPTAQLIDAGSHPDLRRLARLPRDRKPEELARNITVDQVRGIQSLFATTPSMSDWRAVVIDAIDDLERPAANALLKNLEEPPSNCVFLLVCHNPGRVLPTIRSRCRMLRFSRLSPDAMTSAIAQAAPDLDADERTALVRIGNGAPGQALHYAGLDIAALDATIGSLIAEGDAGNRARAALAQSLGLKNAQPRYEAFLDRAPSAIAAHARTLEGRALQKAVSVWEEARALAGGAQRLSLDPQTTVFALAGLLASLHEPRHDA
ncbi:DNA polymerase III subunit delta' [Parasphingopyxis algicola]|uniref:DNA polymerase III subunit delta' n=1 Tax=Parasphingopyxis algicola TaxID=2026624 RepID=UPI0015A16DB6|nr:DNA polymerase III subunit delta' [Parasphingopyxis algicola]QLC24165.1 DNA polymerase III subunit delta' [Parasphingopyxis algicola]